MMASFHRAGHLGVVYSVGIIQLLEIPVRHLWVERDFSCHAGKVQYLGDHQTGNSSTVLEWSDLI